MAEMFPNSASASKVNPIVPTIVTAKPAQQHMMKIQDAFNSANQQMIARRQNPPQIPQNPSSLVVDFLGSKGLPTDYSSRANLALRLGIPNYTGSMNDNARLLQILQSQQPQK